MTCIYYYRSVATCIQFTLLIIFTVKCGATEYFVKPTNSVNVTCPLSQPCLTINQYTDPSNHYMEINNTVFTFLPGNHVMERPIEFSNVMNITLHARNDDDAYPHLLPKYMCKTSRYIQESYIHFETASNLYLPCCCSTIHMKKVVNVTISGIIIGTTVNISGIFIESSTNIHIQKNIISSNNEHVNATHGIGIHIKTSIHVIIEDQQTRNVLFGVLMWEVNDVIVQNSFFQNCLYYGLSMIETNYIKLLNLVTNQSGVHGIKMNTSKYSLLENIHVTLSGLSGLSIINSTNTTMMNISSVANQKHGIFVSNSTHTIIMKSLSMTNKYEGVYMFFSNDTNMVNISSMNNQNHGIYLGDCNDTAMMNISLINNLNDGIYVEYSTNITMINIILSLTNHNATIGTVSNSLCVLQYCLNVNIISISVDKYINRNAIYFFCSKNILVQESIFSGIISGVQQSTSSVTDLPAIITLYKTNFNLKNCNFTSNMITSITATSSNITVEGNIHFENISTISGAAFILSGSSVLIVSEQSNVVFLNNSASQYGSALYIDNEEILETSILIGDLIHYRTSSFFTSVTQCFIQVKGNRTNTARLTFINNTAMEGGDVLYGGQIVTGYDGDWNCLLSFKNISNMSYSSNETEFRQITSAPSRVCQCHDTSPDCLIIVDPTPHTIYPGETMTMSVAVVGQDFGTVSGYVYAQIIDNELSHASVKTNQKRISYDNGACNHLKYTFYSNCEKCEAVLVLTSDERKVSQMMNINNNQRINQSWSILQSQPDYHALAFKYAKKLLIVNDHKIYFSKDYDNVINSVIDNFFTLTPENLQYNRDLNNNQLLHIPNKLRFPQQIYTYPFYINIQFRPCPLGFTLSQSQCDCNQLLQHMPTVECDIQNQTITRAGSVWVGIDDNGAVTASQYCPLNYCRNDLVQMTLQNINSTSPDTQCNYKHSGILCGGCRPGLSLALGSDQCMHCSNAYISLILPFAIAGVVLVLFIKVLDFTVCQGTINGLIFYANIINANKHLYYNQSDINPITLFIAWFNLDLGFETCFYDGLTAYARTWLQFIFPIYIWSIAGAIIILANQSKRIAAVSGNNGVPVLATLFLLSYAKLFNTVISVISYTTLYTTHSQRLVWSIDGNIDYLGPEHAPLFAVALIILLFLWLPYTLIILFGKYLHKINCYLITHYLLKLKPFLDANYAPFHDHHQYWFGVILFVKAIILVSSATIPANSAHIVVYSVAVASFVLLFWGNLVFCNTKTMLFHTIVFVNLGILNNTKNLIFDNMGEMTIASYTLIGIVVIQFLGLCLVKTVKLFSANWSKHDITICYRSDEMEDDWEPYLRASLQRVEESGSEEDNDSHISEGIQSPSTYPLV